MAIATSEVCRGAAHAEAIGANLAAAGKRQERQDKELRMAADEIARKIVDAAIQVHRALGPGLLESAYQACLAHELRRRQHWVECELLLPLQFEGVLMSGFSLGLIINWNVLCDGIQRVVRNQAEELTGGHE